ncbi:MAG: thiamine pyrophosphate-dependent dehydrogenase E1 component subunit alpha [Euryarchaeota archaeon]|nr:thiamine pyrophosphate-dependent dehydrogenase E1 component subunit alpha [Euryarchaeota archaeon]
MQKSAARPDIPVKTLHEMYMTMMRIRKFEEKVASLIIKKEIQTPCHLYVGQEAVATGVCASLRKEDYVFSTHRSHGHYIAKGGDLKKLMAELYCKETGCSKGRGGSMHIADPDVGLPGSSAIVAGTIPLSVGVAYSFSLQKKNDVSVAFFGDGAVGEGVFYESLNLAALRKLPVIFVCENNLFSTHLPISACLADTDIKKKAEAFSIPAVRIDGNDVLTVYRTAKKMIDDARHNKGPAFIECMTYRWFGHVGPNYDIDKGLRSKEDLEYWMKRDPIKRLEQYMLRNKLLSASKKRAIEEMIKDEIKASIAFKNKSRYPEKTQLTQSVFKEA